MDTIRLEVTEDGERIDDDTALWIGGAVADRTGRVVAITSAGAEWHCYPATEPSSN